MDRNPYRLQQCELNKQISQPKLCIGLMPFWYGMNAGCICFAKYFAMHGKAKEAGSYKFSRTNNG